MDGGMDGGMEGGKCLRGWVEGFGLVFLGGGWKVRGGGGKLL